MLSRPSSLLRVLLTASLPFAAAGGAAVVPLATLGGCACDEATSVFPISRHDFDTLTKRYGSDGVPVGDCQRLCVLPETAEADAGADGGDVVPAARVFVASECALTTIEWDTPAVACTGTPDCGPAGRRPEGLLPADRLEASSTALGAHFARAARLEAASVPAFLDLARELAALGAAAAFVRAAERAAAEEVAHARVMARLARRHGARPLMARVAPRGDRDLEAMARENATEGCVFEAFGAALLTHQAITSADPVLRAAFASIAADEARHADLSRRIHLWAQSQLGSKARRRLALAREEALSALARAEENEPVTAIAASLGLPSAERAQSMIATLAA
ncbi:MAG: hypothetical protein ACMG6S_15055 [Byssovorax sp.]